MYAVIFRAKIAQADKAYFQTAERMRELACGKYGCLEFVYMTEGKEEIAISYWETEKQIQDWKKDPEHIKAQQQGRTRWYESYNVEVCKVERSYTKKPGDTGLFR
jgi:heme-degrading monooxygenase HmoA